MEKGDRRGGGVHILQQKASREERNGKKKSNCEMGMEKEKTKERESAHFQARRKR